jgi:hypothetical protein
MAVIDLFSKRRKRAESAGKPVLYTYDFFPKEFRVQVVHIWRTAIGPWFETGGWSDGPYPSNGFWSAIHDMMARELGVPALAHGSDPSERCVNFLGEADADGVLNIVELSFRVIDRGARRVPSYQREKTNITQDADDAIAELNERFREHAIGYQYREGELIRVDSEYLHTTSVEPALTLLHDMGFTGPNAEFLSGHEHYRKGAYKEAIADHDRGDRGGRAGGCARRGAVIAGRGEAGLPTRDPRADPDHHAGSGDLRDAEGTGRRSGRRSEGMAERDHPSL